MNDQIRILTPNDSQMIDAELLENHAEAQAAQKVIIRLVRADIKDIMHAAHGTGGAMVGRPDYAGRWTREEAASIVAKYWSQPMSNYVAEVIEAPEIVITFGRCTVTATLGENSFTWDESSGEDYHYDPIKFPHIHEYLCGAINPFITAMMENPTVPSYIR